METRERKIVFWGGIAFTVLGIVSGVPGAYIIGVVFILASLLIG